MLNGQWRLVHHFRLCLETCFQNHGSREEWSLESLAPAIQCCHIHVITSHISMARNTHMASLKHKGAREFCLVKMRRTRYSWARVIIVVCPVLLVINIWINLLHTQNTFTLTPSPREKTPKFYPIMTSNSKCMNSRWHVQVSISGLHVTPLYSEAPNIHSGTRTRFLQSTLLHLEKESMGDT